MIDGIVLARGVHAVIADERAVFLDTGRDRYFKLDLSQTRILSGPNSEQRTRLVGGLVQKGLAADRTDPAPPESVRPQPARSGDGGVAEVLGACAWAAKKLRCSSFADVVNWARRSRQADALPRNDLIERFLSRRPFYPRNYNCLFDSLALAHFLRLRGAAGDWVFGVRGLPFAAHCWIEVEGLPVNDEAGFVAPYQPILIL
jgi:hypothetical protein